MAKMYQLVSNVREGKPVMGEDMSAHGRAWEQRKLADKGEQKAKKGWVVASEDLRGTGSSLENTQPMRGGGDAAHESIPSSCGFDQKVTIKRND